jgi:hypothetical protein
MLFVMLVVNHSLASPTVRLESITIARILVEVACVFGRFTAAALLKYSGLFNNARLCHRSNASSGKYFPLSF